MSVSKSDIKKKLPQNVSTGLRFSSDFVIDLSLLRFVILLSMSLRIAEAGITIV